MVLHQRWIYAKSEPMALTVYKRHGTALGVIPESGGGFHGDNISPPAHSAPVALLLHFAMTTPITPSSSPTNLQENGEEETNNMVATPPVETSTSEVRVSPPRPSVLVPPQNDAISRKMQNGHCPTAPPPLPTPSVLSEEEAALLAKLEAANKLIETDVKSLNSLSGITNSSNGHSRKSSDTSQISFNSGSSSTSQDRSDDHEEDQWSLWGRIVTEWETYFKKRNQYVKELVRKGIPHHFRGVVWPLLCGANDSPAKHQYADYIKATSACEKVIRRDIARTYPEHDFFKEKDGLGQESLFNVMKAYSLHDREVGYCQGSAFIVGLLLMQMPEEEAFAVLVKLMQEYRLREMFKPTMAELGLCMYQLKCLVEELLPDLHVHFTSQSFDTSMYASSWFLTLFTTNLTLPVACRVMDTFLSDGMEVIFRVAIAILAAAKDDLLSLDMEGMLKYFQKETPARFDSCPDVLMTAAYNVKYSVKRIRKLEKDYIALKTKEQEDQEEVRRLRTENRMLRQKASMLETESSELAERLVRGQVSKADYEETAFQLQRELEALRQHNAEKTAQLREAQERLKHMEENSSRQSSLENGNSPSLQAELLKQKEELIQCLQEQLIGGRLRQAEMEAMIRDMRTQLQELEEEKKRLRECTPDNTVATLQEELIAVKLREAEATLALKDLRPKIAELSAQWIRHLQEQHADNVQSSEGSSNTPKKLLFWENNRAASKVEEELMTTRLREMEAITELRELRLRVMELETQNQVIGNQLKRQDEENKALKEKLELSEKQEKEYLVRIKEQERKYADLGAKMREDSMLARIRNAENSQLMAELAQKISTLELKNQQLLAEGELSNVEDSERVRELQERVADFKAEVKRLEHVNKKLSLKISPSTGSNGLRQEQQQQANRPGSLMCSNRNSKSASPPASPVSEEEDFSQLHLRLSPRNSVTSLNSNL